MEKLYYEEYFNLERNHWWFKARSEILESVLENHFLGNSNNKKILNAGAATGATSTTLNKYGKVISLEYDKDCYEFLLDLFKEDVINASLTELPFSNESFDLVCAFDVIEHIEEDEKAIKEIHRTLNKNGLIYLTVPAFNFLWSKHDIINHHIRRYRIRDLNQLLEKNKFEIIYKTYFNFYLFIPILIIRFFAKFYSQKDRINSSGSDFEKFQGNNIANRFFYRIFKSEIFFLSRKISFPFGVSAMILGRKIG